MNETLEALLEIIGLYWPYSAVILFLLPVAILIACALFYIKKKRLEVVKPSHNP